MTQAHTNPATKATRPGMMRSPHEEFRLDGFDHRHRPHKECLECGTSLHCSASRKSGFCRVCQPYDKPTLVQVKTGVRLKHAQEIKGLRLAAGFTQAELADRLDVSQVTIAHWEHARHGIRPARLRRLRKICKESDYAKQAS